MRAVFDSLSLFSFSTFLIYLCLLTFVSIHSLNIGPLVKQDCSQRYGLYAPTSSLVTTDIWTKENSFGITNVTLSLKQIRIDNLNCKLFYISLLHFYVQLSLKNERRNNGSKKALEVNYFVNLIWLFPLNVPFVTLYLINVLSVEKRKNILIEFSIIMSLFLSLSLPNCGFRLIQSKAMCYEQYFCNFYCNFNITVFASSFIF